MDYLKQIELAAAKKGKLAGARMETGVKSLSGRKFLKNKNFNSSPGNSRSSGE